MIHVTIKEAKTHLSKFIQQAREGEEVIIAKGQQPLVKLVALPEGTSSPDFLIFSRT